MFIGPEVLFSYTPTYDYGWKVKVTDKFYAKVLHLNFLKAQISKPYDGFQFGSCSVWL